MWGTKPKSFPNLAAIILLVLLSASLVGGLLISVFAGNGTGSKTELSQSQFSNTLRGYTAPGGPNPDGTVLTVMLGQVDISKDPATGLLADNRFTKTSDIKNGQFARLNYDITDHGTPPPPTKQTRDAIYIGFGVTGESVVITAVDIKLNGNISLSANIIEQPDENTRTFAQEFFAMPASYINAVDKDENPIITDTFKEQYYTKSLTGNNLEAVEGMYTIQIDYRRRTANGLLGQQTLNFSFYLVTEESYNDSDWFNIKNTVVDKTPASGSILQKHYFNFNNFYDANGNLNKKSDGEGGFKNKEQDDFTQLDYPTAYYNPEKFRISYIRELYDIKEIVQLGFRTTGNGASEEGFVTRTMTRNGVNVPLTDIPLGKPVGGEYKAEFKFDAVGEYTFTKQTIIKRGQNDYFVLADSAIVNGDPAMTQPETLTIYGFASMFSQGGNRNAPFYAVDPYGTGIDFVSDVTFANLDFMSKSNNYFQPGFNNPAPDNVPNLNGAKRATTNQGPVLFESYLFGGAKLTTTAIGSNTEPDSYYVHTSLLGVKTRVSINSTNVRLSTAGTYVVVLQYSNPFLSSSGSTYAGQSNFRQVFTFTITSTPPVVTLFSGDVEDPSDLQIDGLGMPVGLQASQMPSGWDTNQNVWIQLEQAGPFDAPIRAAYNYRALPTAGWSTFTAFNPFSYKFDGTNKIPTTNAEIFKTAGQYEIRIYHTNSDRVYAVYSFIIDRTPISGISAVEIQGSLNNYHVSLNASISSQTEFNLFTDKTFGFTWGNKPSESPISASYIYAPLTTDLSFVNHEGLIVNSDLWVTVNAMLGGLTAPVPYTKIIPDKHLAGSSTPLSNSQVFSQNMFVILLLSDRAGNTAMFPIIRENVSPGFLRTQAVDLDSFNVVNEEEAEQSSAGNTRITWGSHKAMGVSTGLYDALETYKTTSKINGVEYAPASASIISELNKVIKKDASVESPKTWLAIPLTTVTALVADNTEEVAPGNPPAFTLDASLYRSAIIIVDSDAKPATATLKWGILPNQNSPHNLHTEFDRIIFTFNIAAQRGNHTTTVEINLDQSLGKLMSYTNGEEHQVSQTRSTNRQHIQFQWKDELGQFEIESVILEFYPLVYDDVNNAATFPYRSTPSITATLFNHLQGFGALTSLAGSKWQTGDLLSSYSSVFGDTASTAGKYVIIRTYLHLDDTINAAELKGDRAVRKYVFYVDRNKPISNVDRIADGKPPVYTIGEDVRLEFGTLSSGIEPFNSFSRGTPHSFTESFSSDFSSTSGDLTKPRTGNPSIASNKLPAKINSSSNKYIDAVEKLLAMNMCALVQFQPKDSEDVEQTFYYNDSLRLANKAFTRIGTYRVVMFDLSNYNHAFPISGEYDAEAADVLYEMFKDYASFTFQPNFTIFTFEIEGRVPEGEYQQHVSGNDYINLGNLAFTSSNEIRFMFEDPAGAYAAKINTNSVRVTRTMSGLTRSFILNNSDIVKVADNNALNTTTFPAPNSTPGTFTKSDIKYVQVPIAGSSPERYRYYILLAGSNLDCLYEVFVQYEGTRADYAIGENKDDYSNFERAFVVNIDHTPPTKNLLSFIDADKFLSIDRKNELTQQINANTLKAENIKFLKHYAFAVPYDSKLTISDWGKDYSEFNPDGQFWYRAYDKYNGDNYDKQTVVPGDEPSFTNESWVKFISTNPMFKAVGYNITPKGIVDHNGGGGYFDIIERDAANNYRVYTLFIDDAANSLSQIEIEASSERGVFKLINTITSGSQIFLTQTTGGSTAIEGNSFSSADIIINSFIAYDKWFELSFRDITTNSSAPYTSIFRTNEENVYSVTFNALRATLNNLLTGTDKCFEIRLTNRFGESFSLFVKLPGAMLSNPFVYTPAVNGNSFTLALPTDSPSTEYVGFLVWRANISGWEEHPLTQDDGLPPPRRNLVDFKNPANYTNGRITFRFQINNNTSYKFELTDNFGRVYKFDVYGSGDVRELTPDSPWLQHNGLNHTHDYVNFRFTTDRYDFELSILDLTTNQPVAPVDNGTLYEKINYGGFTIYRFVPPANASYKYTITLKYDEVELAPIEFVIYNILPDVEFLDFDLNPIWPAAGEKVTSRNVTVNWSNAGILFEPYAEYRKDNGPIQPLDSNTTFSQEGRYDIFMRNLLGKEMRYQFTIRADAVNVYGVFSIERVGSTDIRTPVSAIAALYSYTDLTFGQMNIPNYVYVLKDITRPAIVEVNDNKSLQSELIATLGNTKIYRVYGTTTHNISLFFAVTSVSNINNLTSFSMNGNSTGSSHRITPPDTKAVFKWNAMYTDTSFSVSSPTAYNNFYFVVVEYEGHYVGTFNANGNPEGSIELTESGTYRIYIRDVAGREHRFTNSAFYSVTILTQINYRVNTLPAIQGAIYNGAVSLQITQLDQYLNTPVVTVWHNKQQIHTAVSATGFYRFTDWGFYEIEMSANLRNVSSSVPAIKSFLTFTVINALEARLMYEFTPISGYTITKIVRAGTDITEQVRADQETATGESIPDLRMFFASPEVYGIASYTIFVSVAGSGYLPAMAFNFSFIINNAVPVFTPSVPFGTETTEPITVKYNPAIVYSLVGESILRVTGRADVIINASSVSAEVTIPAFVTTGTYYVQLFSTSGNLIASYRFVIAEPLSTAAIVLICVGAAVVLGVTATFIFLRTRMRVR
ncbi:MAG: hypothetical protein FWE53_04755 [Firmicutes bacterium]|nr:hypothetical protein [Bacillota bacterium]